MMWKEPEDWKLPPGDTFYKKFKDRGELLSMTQPSWDIIKDHLKGQRVCIDVGAHIGTTVVQYAKHFERVIAFEPIYWEILKENTQHLDNVIVENIALTGFKGNLLFEINKPNSGMTRVHSRKGKSVPAYPLDKAMKTFNGVKDKWIDFIKIDTEGYTLPILQGAEFTIKEHAPILEIEMKKIYHKRPDPRWDEDDRVLELLQSWEYEMFDQYHVDCFFKRV